jgi:hypothetical protein
MFKKAAALHRKQFDKYVEEAGEWITVRQPPVRTTNTSVVDKVLGADEQESEIGVEMEVKALWSTTYMSLGSMDSRDILEFVKTLGLQSNELGVVLRVRLDDVLLDPALPYGRTLFSTAREVVHMGQRFKVTGQKPAGLGPGAPYLLYVGLTRIAGD